MQKKLAAGLTIAIFLISTLAIVSQLTPVSAHFTLGDYTATSPYHVCDFDGVTNCVDAFNNPAHVPGVIGYVWPGSGSADYIGQGPALGFGYGNNNAPGYMPPFPGHDLAGTGVPSNWLQLDQNAYAPFGAVLTGTTGDLIFAVNATKLTTDASFTRLYIAIPPEFTVPSGVDNIVTTTTNNYGSIINYGKISPYDRWAPNFTLLRIGADNIPDRAVSGDYVSKSANPGLGAGIRFFQTAGAGACTIPGPNGVSTTGGVCDPWYYVRINGVTAPTVAGKYFFKLSFRHDGSTDSYYAPVENWPVMLVKGEIDPAIITGTIQYGGYNATLYGQPVQEAGAVWAHMTTKLDPYTGSSIIDCSGGTLMAPTAGCTDAVGYFNATAHGHYEIEGVAPGTYDIYAEAAGYPQTVIASGVNVLKGQSLHFNGYLQPGAVIHGDVNSKHQFGLQPWPYTAYMKIELYDQPTNNHAPQDSSGNALVPVSWSPLPCVAGGQDRYRGGTDAQGCGDPRTASKIAFPWHEWVTQDGFPGAGAGFSYDFSLSGVPKFAPAPAANPGAGNNNNMFTTDPAGVGPAQNWFVVAGTSTPFHFEFGVKGEFGAPKDMDGHVPQLFATWINGLTPGRYYVRAWTFRYVQSALDGATFQEYPFDVTPQEWAGDVTLPIDLRLSSWVNKTVHFHDLPGTINTDPLSTGVQNSYDPYMVGGLYGGPYTGALGSTGSLASWNVTNISNGEGSQAITFFGFNDTWIGDNYGIPAGTYTPYVYVQGYLQQTFEQVSVTLSGNPTFISDHMYRGVGLNITAYSVDWERPRVNRNWVWDGAEIDFAVLDANGTQVNNICYECNAGNGVTGGLATTVPPYPADTQSFEISGTPGVISLCGGAGICTTPAVDQEANTYFMEVPGLGVGNANGAWFGTETIGEANAGHADVGGYTGYASGPPGATGANPHVQSPLVGGFGFTTAVINNWHHVSYFKPTALDSGQYCIAGWTYGYVQDKQFCVYANKGEIADIKVNFLIGVNITLDILFKKEHIITPTAFNMSARVRVFDDSGVLVGEWMTSEGTYVTGNGQATSATCGDDIFGHTGPGSGCLYPWDGGLEGATPIGFNYLPGGVTNLHVLIAGLAPDATDTTTGTWGDPVFANSAINCDFEVDCTGPGLIYPSPWFVNNGISGAPDYTGSWTVETDFVNWYANNTSFTTEPAGVVINHSVPQYYPPVVGLLQGESYHIIPGTTATTGVSLTEDGAENSAFLGLAAPGMERNHLGPYQQQGVWQLSNAHLSGEVSGVFELDLAGYVSGSAWAFTWSNEFRPLSWATVTIASADGKWTFTQYTQEGIYEGYLPPGSYTMTISAPGITSQTQSFVVTAGQSSGVGTGQQLYMEQSNIPVPEFSGIAIMAFSALAASLYLLRRRRR
ncbi:MAG: carboxypeptidase-like regulatory domain-containing protein [Candidatus Bathyarchaeia archaeon]